MQYITKAKDVEVLCKAWSTAEAIAVDTEFIRSNTYYPRLCLVQVCDGHRAVILDAIELRKGGMAPFVAILEDRRITKVLFDMTQDIECFMHTLNARPQSVFDVKLALGFGIPGLPPTSGYAQVVGVVTGVSLPKGMQKSPWGRRPLTPAQLDYAINDVLHMLQAYSYVKENLAADRLIWAWEESDRACNLLTNPPVAAGENTLATKYNPGALPRAKQYLLSMLLQAREVHAKSSNLPRGWVATDQEIYAASSGTIPNSYTEFWYAAHDIITSRPTAPPSFTGYINHKNEIADLKDSLQSFAESLNMSTPLLAPKVILNNILEGATLDGTWRAKVGLVDFINKRKHA